MTPEDAKKAIVLNYSLMCGEIGKTVQEKVMFIHKFFDENPVLTTDYDLHDLNEEFYRFMYAFKNLDSFANQLGEKLK